MRMRRAGYRVYFTVEELETIQSLLFSEGGPYNEEEKSASKKIEKLIGKVKREDENERLPDID
jgi:hypothetical protein